MLVRKPRLSVSPESSSYVLLKEALGQYHVELTQSALEQPIRCVGMDDIDVVEAIELVEEVLGVRIDKESFGRATTFADVVNLLDGARS
jgi:hypothetical protein